jgi:hypothetical protein
LLLQLVSAEASERHSLYIFLSHCRQAGRPSWLFHSALPTTGDTAWGWRRVLHLYPAIALHSSAISSIASVRLAHPPDLAGELEAKANMAWLVEASWPAVWF